MAWDSLTPDIWTHILRHVGTADRVARCSVVCKKLNKAAAAATQDVQLSLWRCDVDEGLRQRWAQAFESYLQKHGRHLTSLQLFWADQPLFNLPCANLKSLDLVPCAQYVDPFQLGYVYIYDEGKVFVSPPQLQLAPGNGLPVVFDSCPALTALKLSGCAVEAAGLSSLSLLTDLRALRLKYVFQPGTFGGYEGPKLHKFPGSVFSSIPHLTSLELLDIGGIADVHHLSTLCRLSVLDIECDARERSTLEPANAPGVVTLVPANAPGFVLSAALQSVHLSGEVVVDPAVLLAATQLTRLCLFQY